MHGIRQNGKWNADFYSKTVKSVESFSDFVEQKWKNGQHPAVRFLFLWIKHLFFCGCRGKHQLDSVFLIDFCCTGVVIDGNNICLWVSLLDGTGHTLCHNVIRQAAERLGADDVFNAMFTSTAISAVIIQPSPIQMPWLVYLSAAFRSSSKSCMGVNTPCSCIQRMVSICLLCKNL